MSPKEIADIKKQLELEEEGPMSSGDAVLNELEGILRKYGPDASCALGFDPVTRTWSAALFVHGAALRRVAPEGISDRVRWTTTDTCMLLQHLIEDARSEGLIEPAGGWD